MLFINLRNVLFDINGIIMKIHDLFVSLNMFTLTCQNVKSLKSLFSTISYAWTVNGVFTLDAMIGGG